MNCIFAIFLLFTSLKRKTLEEIEQLDPDDRHYNRRKADLDDRLYRMYDKILIYFDKFYKLMNDDYLPFADH